MLDSDIRSREKFGGVLGGAFEVAKHLGGVFTGGVDIAALGADAEALGGFVVEVDAPIVLAVGANPHSSFCTPGTETVGSNRSARNPMVGFHWQAVDQTPYNVAIHIPQS